MLTVCVVAGKVVIRILDVVLGLRVGVLVVVVVVVVGGEVARVVTVGEARDGVTKMGPSYLGLLVVETVA